MRQSGLHDLVDPGPGEGKEHVDIPTYGKNLVELFKRFSVKAKTVIWTTTTPCPNVTTSLGRSDAKVRAYNAEAEKVLSAAANGHLVVDDLYEAVDQYCGANYKACVLQRPKNVHLTAQGCEFTGEHVVATVLKALGRLGHPV